MSDFAFRIGDAVDCEIQVRRESPDDQAPVFRAEACVVDRDGWCETPVAHPTDPTLRLFVVSPTEAGAVGLMLQELQARFGDGVEAQPIPAITTPRRLNAPVAYPLMSQRRQ